MRLLLKIVVALALVVAIIGGGMSLLRRHNATPPNALRTAQIKRGNLTATISATGTVEPEEVVDVGAQVAGQILYFGKDPKHPDKTIDYGSEVEQGTLLAQIDDALYAADVANAQANLNQASANLQQAQANIAQLDAKVFQTSGDWKRYQQLGVPVIAQTDYDGAKANYDSAVAMRKVGDAVIAQDQAAIGVAQSVLDKAKKYLSYCTITSPVKGVIIDRRVDIGQTVVSSLNTPSLFLIAKDLKRIEVWASVNEADVGQIQSGQAATFTVDAFPGVTFNGIVQKVRLNASMTQNVVTYTVEIATDNSDGKLLPYLTANVQFAVAHRTDVLSVPNAALRWVPQTQQIDPGYRDNLPAEKTPKVWIAEPTGFVRPVEVTAGLTDSAGTEISSPAIKEGDTVAIGQQSDATDDTTNPFMPKFGGKK